MLWVTQANDFKSENRGTDHCTRSDSNPQPLVPAVAKSAWLTAAFGTSVRAQPPPLGSTPTAPTMALFLEQIGKFDKSTFGVIRAED